MVFKWALLRRGLSHPHPLPLPRHRVVLIFISAGKYLGTPFFPKGEVKIEISETCCWAGDLQNSIEKGRWKGLFIRVLQTKFEFPAIEIDSNKDECEIDLLRENLIKLGIFFLCDWEIFSLHRPGLMDETAIDWLENGSDRYSRPNKCLSFKWIISQRVGLPQKSSENWFDLWKVRFRKWSWTLHGWFFWRDANLYVLIQIDVFISIDLLKSFLSFILWFLYVDFFILLNR